MYTVLSEDLGIFTYALGRSTMLEPKTIPKEASEKSEPVVIPCGTCPGWWYEGELPKHWPECEKK